jgi:hypothetical protein
VEFDEEHHERFHVLDDPSADPEDRKMAGFFADGMDYDIALHPIAYLPLCDNNDDNR